MCVFKIVLLYEFSFHSNLKYWIMHIRILGRQLNIFKSKSGMVTWTKFFLLGWLVPNNWLRFSSLSFHLVDGLGKSFLSCPHSKINRQRSIAQCFVISWWKIPFNFQVFVVFVIIQVQLLVLCFLENIQPSPACAFFLQKNCVYLPYVLEPPVISERLEDSIFSVLQI